MQLFNLLVVVVLTANTCFAASDGNWYAFFGWLCALSYGLEKLL